MNPSSSTKLTSKVIEYLVHHIFLPPKLPQADDSNWENETILVDMIFDLLFEFENHIKDDQHALISSVIVAFDSLRAIHHEVDSGGVISEEKLVNALRQLCERGKFPKFLQPGPYR